MEITEQDVERFWARVDVGRSDECWEWEGCTRVWKYGQFWLNGRRELAHRVAYVIGNGDDPGDMKVMHICNNPLCCNPAHLVLGTQQENVRYRDLCSRQARGENIGQSKLTEDDVRKIRQLYATGCLTQQEVGKRFGVSGQQVSDIVNRKYWAWLE